jgi:hypothetical protein
LNIKLLPYNFRGTVAIGAVGAVAITVAGRSAQPYPPGNVKINGISWPNSATLTGDAVLTWAHRIRTAQTDAAIVQQDAASTAGAIEGAYKVEIFINNVVIRTITGLTGTTYTYTLAQRTTDDADMTKLVKFRITPVNGTVQGTARTTDPFRMS